MLKQGNIKPRTVINTIRTMPEIKIKKLSTSQSFFQAEVTLTVTLN